MVTVHGKDLSDVYKKTNIEELSIVEVLKTEDNTNTLEEINKLKEKIANTHLVV